MERDYSTGILFFLVSLIFSYLLMTVVVDRNVVYSQFEAVSAEKTLMEEEYRLNLLNVVATVYARETAGTGGYTTLEGKGLTEVYESVLNGVETYQEALLVFSTYFDRRSKYVDSVPSVWPMGHSEILQVTSGYGWRFSPITGKAQFHAGVDITGTHRAKIVATLDGVVETTWPVPGLRGAVRYRGHPVLGGTVIVRHAGGFTTTYGHLSSVLVSSGQTVKRGTVLGVIGNTGASTGIHLHYEIRLNGESVNPLNYFRL